MSTRTIPVDPTNADALAAWDGDEGDFWAEHERVFDHSLHHYREPFLEAAAVRDGERVLDLGCGNGETTLDLAARTPSGRVLGVDLSARMLERARQRADAAGLANVDLVQADAQVHRFEPAAFDLVASRTGTMFFGDPVAAFTNIRRALRPGGRLVLLVWQEPGRNEWFREMVGALAAGRPPFAPPADAPGPFSMAAPDRGHAVLGAAGFEQVRFAGVGAPMWFGHTAEEAFGFLSALGLNRHLLGELAEPARRQALVRLRASVEAHVAGEGVVYASAVWLVTARRPREG